MWYIFTFFLQEAGDVEVSIDADEKQTMNDATAVAAEPETQEKSSEEPQQPDVSIVIKADSELPTERPSNAEVLGGEDSQQAAISMSSTENPLTDTTDTDGLADKPPSTKTVDAETS